MQQIAILITTFLRDSLLYKTLQTIVDYYPNNCIVLIADQGYDSIQKQNEIEYIKTLIPCEYYKIPFDSGLSYARNFLINKANEMNIPYILMLADSIQFSHLYNFQPFINFLESDKNNGLVGFDLIGSKCPWEFNMEVTSSGIKLLASRDYVEFENIRYKKVDICRNIFLAKTISVLNLYDQELKLGEHEDAFITYKNRGYNVYWTDDISFKKITTITSDEYQVYRKRFGDYKKLFMQKYGLSSWVIYSPEARREIEEYKNKKCI